MDVGGVHFAVRGVNFVIWSEIRKAVDSGSRLEREMLYDSA